MITKPSDFGKALKQGPYAWPGGYPCFFITSDGAALCFQCALAQAKQITDSIRHGLKDGWKVEAVEANWEDPSLYCDHCSDRIESAYAEDEAKATRAGKREI